ncbi:MAG: hypothetical protein PHF56_24930 [Desulfuromonadaceae bacterium]|nr:hypothetical protein [Desulfuromonadaceae bacterium]
MFRISVGCRTNGLQTVLVEHIRDLSGALARVRLREGGIAD